MSATATLVYHATALGPSAPAALENAMSLIALDFLAIEQATGAALISDVTTLLGGTATRTINFNINNPVFQGAFPVGTDQAAPFHGLYTQALSAGLNTKIVEDPVVIA